MSGSRCVGVDGKGEGACCHGWGGGIPVPYHNVKGQSANSSVGETGISADRYGSIGDYEAEFACIRQAEIAG